MMATVYVYAVRYNYPKYEKSSFSQFLKAFAGAAPGLVTPVIILAGISFGVFTPTEASAIAVIYTILVGILNKSLDLPKFLHVLSETARLVGVSLFCVGTASVFSWLMAYYQVPQSLVQAIQAWGLGPKGIILVISAVFLIVGLFIDAIPAIIIVGSIMYPLAQAAGIHPIHFSLVGVVSLAFGLVTPPYGMCLLIASRIGELSVHKVLKDVVIILLPMLFILIALCLFPEIVLFLPRLIAPQFM
jgi:tripartite ATP-independent transporter DctM subunit